MVAVITPDNLGNGFSIDIPNEKIHVAVTPVMGPIYEYQTFWAEEHTIFDANGFIWSFGNGAVDSIGLPIGGAGWELVGLGFQANTYASAATVDISVRDIRTTPDLSAPTIGSISLSSATDGGGQTDNASKYVDLSGAPLPVPVDAVIAFFKESHTGLIENARILARFRREVGQVVTGLTIG